MSTSRKNPTLSKLLEAEDTLFLPLAYKELLGREPDTQGVHHYTGLLASGRSRLSVLMDIRMSNEARNFPARPAIPELDRLCKYPRMARLFDKLKSLPASASLKERNPNRQRLTSQEPPTSLASPMVPSPQAENTPQREVHLPLQQEQELSPQGRSPKDYFDSAYYLSCHPDVERAGVDAYSHYMNFGWKENRNPSPEFDTHFYKITNLSFSASASINPLQHFAEVGEHLSLRTRPDNSITISDRMIQAASEHKPNQRVAIHVHLYYPEMVAIFAGYLLTQKFEYDLFLSTTTAANARFLENYFKNIVGGPSQLFIRVVPNRGRDVAPFLIGFKDLFVNYDLICHLHSKRSPHSGFGEAWLSWTLQHLFGNPGVALACLRHMEKSPDCAVLFPDNYFEVKHVNWGGNEARLTALAEFFGSKIAELPAFANFSAGSMAWFRASFLERVTNTTLRLSQFEEEKSQVEGTMAHLLERALPLLAQAQGSVVTRFYLPLLPLPLYVKPTHSPSSPYDSVGSRWLRDTPAISTNVPQPAEPLSRLFNKSQLIINWIIPDFIIGAGGHMTIFRIIQLLELFGHYQVVWIQNPSVHTTPLSAKNDARDHYRKLGDRVHFRFLPDYTQQISGDVVIATDCWTAFPASNARNIKERFYFIQDFEPHFHPMGDNYLTAEATYSLGFAALCAGPWLLNKALEYGMWARAWDLSADGEHYYAIPRMQTKGNPTKKRIAFYSRGHTPRRAVPLGIAALNELSKRRSDFEVLLFGEPPANRTYGFPATECGILEPRQLGDLYREADVGLVFSATNYSLIPLEMMACDLPVVELDCESTRAAFPDGTVVRAAPSVLAVADSIERILDDEELRKGNVERARHFISQLSWERSARAIEGAIIDRLLEKGFVAFEKGRKVAPPLIKKRRASIVIPTFNGGNLFKEVLTAASNQAADFDYDILVVDSSSTDGTGAFAKRFGGKVRLHEIPQHDFQHGRTRNLGVSLSDGEVVAFLTQDARPKDSAWLRNLIAGFSLAPDVAGVTGRHEAYGQHNRLLALDLSTMFDRMRDYGPLFSLQGGLPSFIRPESVDWRMLMHFYSDNNSALRRDIWRELPYPEIEWGEDQVWCWNFLQLGLAKAYIDEAVVYHSHPFKRATTHSVAMSEGYMFAYYFGYHLGLYDSQEEALDRIKADSRLQADRIGAPVDDFMEYVELQRATLSGRARGASAAFGA